MALILPPDTAYDSFVSVADALGYIQALTLDSAAWIAIGVDQQEVYLRIATRRIQDGIDQELYPIDPAALPTCLAEATSLMAVHDLVNGISSGSATASETGAIKKEQVGTIVQEYYDTKSVVNSYTSLVPALARVCLESMGYEFPTSLGGLFQLTLGKS